MAKPDIDAGFRTWWDKLSDQTRAAVDKKVAWMAFAAGNRHALAKGPSKTYRFRTGRWRIAVKATDYENAMLAAVRKLNQRAETRGVSPPAAGWTLTRIEEPRP